MPIGRSQRVLRDLDLAQLRSRVGSYLRAESLLEPLGPRLAVLRPGLEALSNLESLTSILPDKDYEILQPRGLVEYLLAGASCSAIGFGEELLFRGYLIPRLERLIGSKWKSIGVTALLFAFWHAYQGVYGVAGAAVWGFSFGILFCGFRRLWPLAMAHALHNFLITIRFLG